MRVNFVTLTENIRLETFRISEFPANACFELSIAQLLKNCLYEYLALLCSDSCLLLFAVYLSLNSHVLNYLVLAGDISFKDRFVASWITPKVSP